MGLFFVCLVGFFFPMMEAKNAKNSNKRMRPVNMSR